MSWRYEIWDLRLEREGRTNIFVEKNWLFLFFFIILRSVWIITCIRTNALLEFMMIQKYALTVIVAVAIIVLSLIPIPEVKELESVPLVDKWTHMVMYAALAGAVWVDKIRCSGRKVPRWRLAVVGVVMAIVLGGALELIQPSVGRSCELLDWVADGIGGVLGVAAGFAYWSFQRE